MSCEILSTFTVMISQTLGRLTVLAVVFCSHASLAQQTRLTAPQGYPEPLGANVNFTEDGQFHSILDAALITHLTSELSQAQGLGPINYIGGGAVDFTAKEK